MTDEYRLSPQNCPVCNWQLDAATRLHGEGGPDPESVTLCINCGVVLGWDYAMRLYALTGEEIRELPPNIFAIVARTQQRVFRIKGERN